MTRPYRKIKLGEIKKNLIENGVPEVLHVSVSRSDWANANPKQQQSCAVCRGMVRNHGGHIKINGDGLNGQGFHFTFRAWPDMDVLWNFQTVVERYADTFDRTDGDYSAYQPFEFDISLAELMVRKKAPPIRKTPEQIAESIRRKSIREDTLPRSIHVLSLPRPVETKLRKSASVSKVRDLSALTRQDVTEIVGEKSTDIVVQALGYSQEPYCRLRTERHNRFSLATS